MKKLEVSLRVILVRGQRIRHHSRRGYICEGTHFVSKRNIRIWHEGENAVIKNLIILQKINK